MKKRIVIVITILMLGQMSLRAQDHSDMERLTTYKIAFFTKRLDLTPAEAEKFWPVYNDYSARKSKIQIDRISMIRYIKQNEALISEKEINESANILSQSYIDESNLTIIYIGEIRKVLPPAKIIKLYQAEAQYKQQLLKELDNRRQAGGQGQHQKKNLN